MGLVILEANIAGSNSHVSHLPGWAIYSQARIGLRTQLSWQNDLSIRRKWNWKDRITWFHGDTELGRTNWISLFLEMMMLSQCLTMLTQGGPEVGTRVQPSYLEPPLLPLLEKGSSRTLGSCFTKSQHCFYQYQAFKRRACAKASRYLELYAWE